MNKTTKEIHEGFEKFTNVFVLDLLEKPKNEMVMRVIDKKIEKKKEAFIQSFFDDWALEDLMKMKHLILSPPPEPTRKKDTSRKSKQKRGDKGMFII